MLSGPIIPLASTACARREAMDDLALFPRPLVVRDSSRPPARKPPAWSSLKAGLRTMPSRSAGQPRLDPGEGKDMLARMKGSSSVQSCRRRPAPVTDAAVLHWAKQLAVEVEEVMVKHPGADPENVRHTHSAAGDAVAASGKEPASWTSDPCSRPLNAACLSRYCVTT